MQLLKNELKGWKPIEIIWLIGTCAIIAALSIYWNDTAMGIISATTGTAYVVCNGKGKLSAYFFGLINSVLYAIIAYNSKLYGEAMLNAFYYVPMQFAGFYMWSKNMSRDTYEVVKKNMTWSGRAVTALSIAAGTVGYGLVLQMLGNAMPFLDSFTTVASVAAMIISVKRFAEQWWIWLVVDAFTVYMWYRAFQAGNDNIATLIMWIVYLINGVIMLIRWEKEARKH